MKGKAGRDKWNDGGAGSAKDTRAYNDNVEGWENTPKLSSVISSETSGSGELRPGGSPGKSGTG